MKQANILLQIDRLGSTIPLRNVTPAEVLYLVADHNANAGKDPIVELIPVADAVRTKQDEIIRLRAKYPRRGLNKVFGSSYEPNLPDDFEAARAAGIGVSLPDGKLIEHQLAL